MDAVKSSFEGGNKNALLTLLLPKPEYEAMCLRDTLKVIKIWCRYKICFNTDI